MIAATLLLVAQAPALPGPNAVSEVLKLTNAARERAGRAQLRLNEALTKAAQAHADDMAKRGYFDHDSPDGKSMSDRAEQAGYDYRALAENIAMGQRTAKQAVDGWMKSPGHRENLLSGTYRELGVGVSKDKKGILRWVQVFGTPRS